MQPDQRPPDGGKLSFLYGLIFGAGMLVLGVIFYCINTFLLSSIPGLTYVITGLAWLINLGLFFLVGTLAARKTGKVGTATITGIWTAVFDGVLYAIFMTIMIFTVTLNRLPSSLPSSSSSTLSPEATRSLAAVIGVFGVVILLLLTIGFGAGIGALGGLLGRSLARKSGNPYLSAPFPYGQQPYPAQPPYPGQPYPAQPPYPGQQPYPGQPYPGQPSQGPSQPGQPGYGQLTPVQSNPGRTASEQSQADQTQLAPPSYKQSQQEQTRLAPSSYNQPVPERPAEPYREQPPAEAEDKTVYAAGFQAGSVPSTGDTYPASDADNGSSSDEQLPYRPN